MQKLDEALLDLRQNMEDPKKQSAFYDLFLNSSFFVPILNDGAGENGTMPEGTRDIVPVVAESRGNDYLMIFSSLERLKGWDQQAAELPHIEVPGYQLALNHIDPLHWAMDAGSEYSKEFLPAEIGWLKEAVERCNAEAAKEAAAAE
jgi:hypothetical protein